MTKKSVKANMTNKSVKVNAAISLSLGDWYVEVGTETIDESDVDTKCFSFYDGNDCKVQIPFCMMKCVKEFIDRELSKVD
jgi:hypothetical protein